MTFISDPQNRGIDPMQFFDPRTRVNMVPVPRCVRVLLRHDNGEYEIEPESYGPYACWVMWPAASSTGFPLWSPIFPAAVETPRNYDQIKRASRPTQFAVDAISAGDFSTAAHLRAVLPAVPDWAGTFPAMWPGVITAGTDQSSAQHEIWMPAGYGLVSVGQDGTNPDCSTRVFATRLEDLDPETWARISTAWRVCRTGWPLRHPIAHLALPVSLAGGVSGVLSDPTKRPPQQNFDRYGLAWELGQPNGGLLGFGLCVHDDPNPGGTIVRGQVPRVWGTASAMAGGPLVIPPTCCVHELGATDDGEPIRAVHLSCDSMFWSTQAHWDHPLYFEDKYIDRVNAESGSPWIVRLQRGAPDGSRSQAGKFAGPGTGVTGRSGNVGRWVVHLPIDDDELGTPSTPGGKIIPAPGGGTPLPGFTVPGTPPTTSGTRPRPPGTPKLPTDACDPDLAVARANGTLQQSSTSVSTDPLETYVEPGKEPATITGDRRPRPLLSTPRELAVPALVLRAQPVVGVGAAGDLRNRQGYSQADVERYRRNPIQARIEVIGKEGGGGQYTRTSDDTYQRYAGRPGHSDGVVAILPGNVGAEDHATNYAPADRTIPDASLAVLPGHRGYQIGYPDPAKGLVRDGWRNDADTSQVMRWRSLDSAGAATEKMRLSTTALRLASIPFEAAEVATPATPDSGHSRTYPKADGAWYELDDAGYEVRSDKRGVGARVDNQADWTLSYDETTRKLTVTATAAVAWYDGRRVAHTFAAVESTAHAATTGTYVFYLQADGTLANTTRALFDCLGSTTAPLATAYYNATTAKGFAFNCLHEATMDSHVMLALLTRGSAYVSGGVISGVTVDTGGSAAQQLALTATTFEGAGLTHANNALVAGTYMVAYRSGADVNGEWSWAATETEPASDDGTNVYYNQLSGGNWSRTAVTANNRWVNYFVVAMPSLAGPQYACIMGQTLHSSYEAARDETIQTIDWGDFQFADLFCPMYQLIYRRAVAAGAPSNAYIDDYLAIYGGTIALGTTAASSPVAVTTFQDDQFRVYGSVDATKQLALEVDGLTTATTRTITMPDSNVDLTANTGTFAAASHATRHTNGSDDIQSATAAQKGLMSLAYAAKLDGIEAGADVTDETNVTAAHPISDATALVKDPVAPTKLGRIDVGAVTAGATRVITMGDRDVNLASGGTFSELVHASRHQNGGADEVATAAAAANAIPKAGAGGTLAAGWLPAATAAAAGAVELATQAEVDAGADAGRVLTPETFAASSLLGGTNNGPWGSAIDGDRTINADPSTVLAADTVYEYDDLTLNAAWTIDCAGYALVIRVAGTLTIAASQVLQVYRDGSGGTAGAAGAAPGAGGAGGNGSLVTSWTCCAAGGGGGGGSCDGNQGGAGGNGANRSSLWLGAAAGGGGGGTGGPLDNGDGADASAGATLTAPYTRYKMVAEAAQMIWLGYGAGGGGGGGGAGSEWGGGAGGAGGDGGGQLLLAARAISFGAGSSITVAGADGEDGEDGAGIDSAGGGGGGGGGGGYLGVVTSSLNGTPDTTTGNLVTITLGVGTATLTSAGGAKGIGGRGMGGGGDGGDGLGGEAGATTLVMYGD